MSEKGTSFTVPSLGETVLSTCALSHDQVLRFHWSEDALIKFHFISFSLHNPISMSNVTFFLKMLKNLKSLAFVFPRALEDKYIKYYKSFTKRFV